MSGKKSNTPARSVALGEGRSIVHSFLPIAGLKLVFRFARLRLRFVLHGRQMSHAPVHRTFADGTLLLGCRKFVANPSFAFRVFAFPYFCRF
jgi:hypothetical protein